MKKCSWFICILLFFSTLCIGQGLKTKNVIVVTLDGVRWQEIFEGADSAILANPEYVHDKKIEKTFWHSDPIKRRALLFPYVWSTIGTQGQLLGNRNYDNFVNCANPHLFSYPGYSEMFVGFVDKRIRSNDENLNPNYTVLEFINQHKAFENKVAAFTTWGCFPYILREEISGIVVNSGIEPFPGDSLSERETMLNELQALIKNPKGNRYDAFTFYFAMEYLARERPKVLFIGLDETDSYSHAGQYDEFLKAAHRADLMLAKLWSWVQSQPDYKDQTTLIITTDHGRGRGAKNTWKNHGWLALGSSQIWIAVIGPDTPDLGEIRFQGQAYQKQIAKTIASFLGLNYVNNQPVGDTIDLLFFNPEIEAALREEASWK